MIIEQNYDAYTDARVVHPLAKDMQERWEICRDFGGGEYEVKMKGRRYLMPLTSDHYGESYADYVRRAKFLPMFRRTVETLVGAATRYPIEYEGPEIVTGEWLRNIDGHGNSIDAFYAALLRELLTVGRAGILVDIGMDDMPVWECIPGDQISTWKMRPNGKVNGLVQKRTVYREKEEWAVKAVEQWRSWDCEKEDGAVTGQLLIEDDSGNLVLDDDSGRPEYTYETTRGEPVWPLVVTTAYESGCVIPDVPPLLGLAYLNWNHYLKAADQSRGMHWVGFATPWFAIDSDELVAPIAVGPNTLIRLPRNSEVGMLEYSGAGLDHIATELDAIKQEGESLGARILAPSVYGTATAERLSAAAETSCLGSIVGVAEQAMLRAAAIHAAYLAVDPEQINIVLNRDFAPVAEDDENLTGESEHDDDEGMDSPKRRNDKDAKNNKEEEEEEE